LLVRQGAFGCADSWTTTMSRTTEAAQLESLGSISSERLLTVRDAANVLRFSESWMAKVRMRGDGPPFVKIGRSVRYRESDLREWLQNQTRRSTSDP
jgi:predicted DNA-binding transcriptional regulator AlpA